MCEVGGGIQNWVRNAIAAVLKLHKTCVYKIDKSSLGLIHIDQTTQLTTDPGRVRIEVLQQNEFSNQQMKP